MKLLSFLKQRYNNSSLKYKLLIPIISILFVSFFIFTVYIVNVQRQISDINLEQKSKNIFLILQDGLVNAVWKFDESVLQESCKAVFEDPEVTMIKVKLHDGKTILNLQKEIKGSKDISIKQNLIKENKKIGEVEMVFTNYYIDENILQIKLKSAIISITIFLIIIFLINILMDFHLKTMNDLMNGVNKLSNGDFKHRIDVRTGDELGKLANSFNIMTREIFKQNEELTKANDELVQTSFTLWGEMAIAKKIQTILLPKKPSISGYEISVYMNPADEVGGDYFDIINIDDKVNWITIGDVSGHGVPAGLIMMMVQSCIRSNINLQPQIAPSDLLNVVNKTISHNIIMMKENKFMTLTTIRLSRDGSAVFSGRHEDIIIYHAKDGIVTTIKTDGICISPFSLGNDNVNKNFKLESGDVLLLYTDGIIEAHKKNVENPDDYYQNTLGISGLCDIIKKYYNQTPEEIKDCILKEMEHFEIKDDISMVIVKKI